MKKKWKVFIAVFVVLGLIGYCAGEGDSDSSTKEEAKTETETEAEGPTGEKKSAWQYSQSQDEMTEAITYYASVNSTNEVEFEFPYSGGSYLSLIVRNTGKKNEVLFSISNGQFNSGIDGQRITLKVDGGEPFKVNCNGASDGRMDVLFVNNPAKLLETLKAAKTLKVQIEFFQEGNKTFDFDIEGLEWQH